MFDEQRGSRPAPAGRRHRTNAVKRVREGWKRDAGRTSGKEGWLIAQSGERLILKFWLFVNEAIDHRCNRSPGMIPKRAMPPTAISST